MVYPNETFVAKDACSAAAALQSELRSYIWISPDTRLHFMEVFPSFLVGSRGVVVVRYLLVGSFKLEPLTTTLLPRDLHVSRNTIELIGNSVEYVLFGSFPFSEFKPLLLPTTDKKFYVKVLPSFKHRV